MGRGRRGPHDLVLCLLAYYFRHSHYVGRAHLAGARARGGSASGIRAPREKTTVQKAGEFPRFRR